MGEWFWKWLDKSDLPACASMNRTDDWYVLRNAGWIFTRDAPLYARWAKTEPVLHYSRNERMGDGVYAPVEQLVLPVQVRVTSGSFERSEKIKRQREILEKGGIDLKIVWNASAKFVNFSYRSKFEPGIRQICMNQLGFYGY